MRDLPLTPAQFSDVCRYVFAHGKFGGPGGIPWRELSRYDEIAEPGDPEEGRSLYVTGGWPVAVYEFDIGYTVISGALLVAE